MQKLNFTQKVRSTAAQLAQVHAAIRDLSNTWEARGYSASGSDPITDTDLVNAGVDANQINLFMAACGQLERFLSAQDVTPGAYRNIINQLRNDL